MGKISSRDSQILEHILKWAGKVEKTLLRYGKDLHTFCSDYDYSNSVSMSLMQIGELAKKLSLGFQESTKDEIPWNLIKGMRNMYAHEYEEMDEEIIFATAVDDIPFLSRKCEKYLALSLDQECVRKPESDLQENVLTDDLEL